MERKVDSRTEVELDAAPPVPLGKRLFLLIGMPVLMLMLALW